MLMETRLTLKPGQKGTKRLVARYGDQLVRVRYRYDPEREALLDAQDIYPHIPSSI
jgi:hypothetical protein